MTSNRRIAFFVPSLGIGGAERVTVTLANGLAERGYTVDLVVVEGGPLASDVAGEVRLVELDGSRRPLVGIGGCVLSIRRYITHHEPAILFSAMTFVNVLTVLATYRSKAETAVVATEHDTFGMNPTVKGRIVEAAATPAYRAADHVVAVSRGVADSVRRQTGVDDSCVSVLYNPVEVAEIQRESREPVDHPWLDDDSLDVVLSVGRLESQKDQATLVRAFATVHERRPETRLLLTGTGSREAALVDLAASLGISDVVSLPGYVDNVYGYMRRADVFALSSRHEGLPTVLIEALACGCPVVSTDCPSGPREILDDGTYGRLVPVGDPASLADGVVDSLKDSTDPDALRSRANDFAADAAVDEYITFVETCLNGNSVPDQRPAAAEPDG
jgi:glycosyltransferase involved in cell wall biosynthesis